MHQCPTCGSRDISLSRCRSSWERLRKAVTKQRAFRCRSCAWRGFGEDTGPTFRPEEIELAYRAVARDDQSWATGDTFRDLDLVTMGAQTEPIGPLGAEPA